MLRRRDAQARTLLFAGVPIVIFVVVFAVSFAHFRSSGKEPEARAAASAAANDAAAGVTDASGGRVVFHLSAQTDEPVEGYLASIGVDGSGLRRITVRPGRDELASDIAPAVSPDGRTIAFQRAVAGSTEGSPPYVYLVGADGSRLRRLTEGDDPELDAAWSPDGRRIAFARETGGQFDVYVVGKDGSGVKRLLGSGGADEDFPSWSPDGKTLVFARYEPGFESASGDLWLANVDGSGERLLLGGPDDDSAPSWSPDGQRIAFLRNGHLAVLDVDTSVVDPLTNPGEVKESRPVWSPEGSRLAFTRDSGSLLVLPLDASARPERVPLDAPAQSAAWERGE
ncbi:MAG: PD40 domain-containing protein [Thermoleophilia bacterium]|nr:PD40 domain-containing protein [Thermoleophilia bacterium]